MNSPRIVPADEFNQDLVEQTHPADWQNPTPQGVYNLVVLGGGTAGIIAALGTAGLGGKVALVERHLLGGDCLNYGCVPSKAIIRSARAIYDAKSASHFGLLNTSEPGVDFPAILQRMRRLRAQISHHDSAARFKSLGVDVYLGDARFENSHTAEVGGQKLSFRRCVIATGGRANVPNIPGLSEVGFLTNETVFSLTELPARLVIVGGGPIGCELAQAFRRFGSEVIIVHRGTRLLDKEEPSASQLLEQRLACEGIRIVTKGEVVRAERVLQRAVARGRITIAAAAAVETVECDAILVATGRTPNIESLNLQGAGVRYTERGVTVDDFLRTSNPRVLAAGDVIGGPLFTHAADAMARICIQNAFFFGRQRLSKLVIPRTTYTDPEVASIGLTASQCKEQGIAIDTYREDLLRVDRAVLDGETAGFAMFHCRKGTGKVVGATIVARHAGEMIGEVSLLMKSKASLGTLANTIHTYPTQVEVLKRLGDQYRRSRLTPTIARVLRWVLQRR